MRIKKILNLNFTSPETGSGIVAVKELQYFEKAGFEVKFAFCNKETSYNKLEVPFEVIKIDKLPVLFKHPEADFTFNSMSKLEFEHYQKEIAIQVEKIINDFLPDLIVVNHVWTLAYEISLYHVPYVIWCHGTDIARIQDPDPNWQKFKHFADKALVGAKKVLFPSGAVRDRFLNTYPEYEDKTIVNHHGYDDNVFFPNPNYKWSPSPTKLVTVGAVDSSKGLHTLAKAMEILGEHYNLTWVGSCKDLDNVKNQYPHINFVGQKSHQDMAEILRGSDIGVLASEGVFEAFGLSALECMACGLPIVLSDMPCFREFTDSKFREFFQPGDSENLAQKIIKMNLLIVKHGSLVGNAAHKKSLEFLWEEHNKRLMNVIHNL